MIPQFRISSLKNPSAFISKHEDRFVYIYSKEWDAYWRQDCCGYTTDKSIAGQFTLQSAFRLCGHAGPEKRINFQFI